MSSGHNRRGAAAARSAFVSTEAADALGRPCPSPPWAHQGSCWGAQGCLAPLGGRLWDGARPTLAPHTRSLPPQTQELLQLKHVAGRGEWGLGRSL